MKSKKNLLELLKSLPHFSKDSVYQLGKQMGIADTTIKTYISRFLAYKEIFRLKNGLYISADYFRRNKNDIAYSFYLANIIRTPSYVSSWSALQYYNMSTETIYNITSITPKVTRNYMTKAGNFSYQSIKNESFAGFSLIQSKSTNLEYFIASPAKALFDLLYFRTAQLRGTSLQDLKKLIGDLRIDIDEMDKKEKDKFYFMIKEQIGDE